MARALFDYAVGGVYTKVGGVFFSRWLLRQKTREAKWESLGNILLRLNAFLLIISSALCVFGGFQESTAKP